MISYKILLLILLVHFLGDFALQTHEQAMRKSFDIQALERHVLTYSLCIGLLGAGLLNGWNIWWFFLINILCHYCTDYITSRLSKPLFEKQDFHNGFVVVGADQLIHTATLVGTYILLS